MCGIAGVRVRAGAAAPARDELLRMAALLRHRGPDGHGLLLDDGVGLAHTRLSLVDLSGGAQPIASEDERLWLVANGEIFDHLTHRAELERRGHRFRTHTDVEVLLHAYEEWGDAAWRRFDGQFAFALWDVARRRLVLVRDRFGILPLVYAAVDGAFVFASEAKALFAGGRIAPRFDPEALRQVFTNWAALPPRTAFAGVAALPPGSFAVVDEDLHVAVATWWRPDLGAAGAATAAPRTLDEAAEALAPKLRAAVARRLVADVPVGSYLSGGLDSSLLTALAAQETDALVTFGIRFDDRAYDESAAQDATAAALGTEHHTITCTSADVRRHLPDVVWHCETPLLRTAPVPLFLLSQLVQRHRIKAVLTGEGADELFGGYSIFLEDRVRRFWARQPDSTVRPALLGRVHDFVATASQRASPMWRAFYGTGLADVDAPFYAHALRWRNTAWASRMLRQPVAPDDATALLEPSLTALLHADHRRWRPLARAQAVEIAAFMGPYLLACQGDRVALGHGVEGRYPFLADDVVAFAEGLQDRHKLRGLTTKLVLRAIARRHLPEAIWRRPKQPYRAPIDAGLFARGGDDHVDALLAPDRLAANEWVDAKAAGLLLQRCARGGPLAEREAMAACGVLTLQLLHDQFGRDFGNRVAAATARLAERHPDVDIDRRGGHAAAPTTR